MGAYEVSPLGFGALVEGELGGAAHEVDVGALWLPGVAGGAGNSAPAISSAAPVAAAAEAAVATEAPAAPTKGIEPMDLTPMTLSECERRLIENTLKSVNGNRNRAAEILGIHRTTLYKKIAEHKLG